MSTMNDYVYRYVRPRIETMLNARDGVYDPVPPFTSPIKKKRRPKGASTVNELFSYQFRHRGTPVIFTRRLNLREFRDIRARHPRCLIVYGTCTVNLKNTVTKKLRRTSNDVQILPVQFFYVDRQNHVHREFWTRREGSYPCLRMSLTDPTAQYLNLIEGDTLTIQRPLPGGRHVGVSRIVG